jgi:hypothetical protein
MKTYTLTNDFHNTSTCVRVPDDGSLSERQIRRCWKALCGIEECTCSGYLGTRGGQEVFFDEQDLRLIPHEQMDGSY